MNFTAETAAAQLSRKRARAAANPQAFAFTISDAQAMGLPGRTTIYRLVKEGQLELIHVGGRSMLTGNSVRRLLGAA